MDIEKAREFCLSLPFATEDMPYGPDWVVFRIRGRIFLHIHLCAPEPCVAVKLPPTLGDELRERYDAVRPAYHLNKRHWSDILIEHTFSDEQIEQWIRISYDTVVAKLPKGERDKMKDER